MWMITRDGISNVSCGDTEDRTRQADRERGPVEKLEHPIVRVDLVELELLLHGREQVRSHFGF